MEIFPWLCETLKLYKQRTLILTFGGDVMAQHQNLLKTTLSLIAAFILDQAYNNA